MQTFKLLGIFSFIFVPPAIGFISVSEFSSLVGVSVDIIRSVVGLKMCAIFAEIKKQKSIIKKNQEKHDKLVFLAKK